MLVLKDLASNKRFGLVDTDHRSVEEVHNSSYKRRHPLHACHFRLDRG